MTPYTAAVLRVLSKAAEPIGWYQIERKLSNEALPERTHLPSLLAELANNGLISVSEHETTPSVRYALTAAGIEAAKTIIHM